MRYAGDDGQADLDAWDALYQRMARRAGRPHPPGDEPARDRHLRPRPAARLRGAGPRRSACRSPPIWRRAQAEVATIGARHGGRTPAEYLDWLGLLAPDLLAAHCIASTDGDLALMAARGATVLNCPRVFARSGTVAAFGRFAAHGVRTVVGTDGYNMDLLGELNAASMISKIAARRAPRSRPRRS